MLCSPSVDCHRAAETRQRTLLKLRNKTETQRASQAATAQGLQSGRSPGDSMHKRPSPSTLPARPAIEDTLGARPFQFRSESPRLRHNVHERETHSRVPRRTCPRSSASQTERCSPRQRSQVVLIHRRAPFTRGKWKHAFQGCFRASTQKSPSPKGQQRA